MGRIWWVTARLYILAILIALALTAGISIGKADTVPVHDLEEVHPLLISKGEIYYPPCSTGDLVYQIAYLRYWPQPNETDYRATMNVTGTGTITMTLKRNGIVLNQHTRTITPNYENPVHMGVLVDSPAEGLFEIQLTGTATNCSKPALVVDTLNIWSVPIDIVD